MLSRLLLAGLSLFSCIACAQILTPVRISENAFAFPGSDRGATPDSQIISGNAGFIVGPDGVVVIDTGLSYRNGERMIDAIARVTDRPVVLVIITHAVQEFVFGAGAFDKLGVPIGAHQATIALMKARCQHCLDNMKPALGEELNGTRLVLPGIAWHGPMRITAGGLDLELLNFGWAATPGDIAVFDRKSGTLFAGGLLATDHVPEIRDCDFYGWRRAIASLTKMPLRHIVPGHGPISGTRALIDTDRYLAALDSQVGSLYQHSSSLIDALEQADLPEFAAWSAYQAHHRKNVLHRYLQLEIEDLGGDPRSTALPQ